jgi:DNA-binding NarL/FixJ family response regulator
VLAALRAGASGFLGKSVGPTELLAGIRTVAAGDALLSSRATATLIAQFLTQPDAAEAADDPDRLAALTQREREIVALVGTGLTNDEIAERLVVSPLTAKTHVNRSMMKLGVRDRAAGRVRVPDRVGAHGSRDEPGRSGPQGRSLGGATTPLIRRTRGRA